MWFDPFSVSSLDDPYPLYRRLRDEHPVYHYHVDGKGVWVLSRYDDVSVAFTDQHTFANMSHIRPNFDARWAMRARHLDGGRPMVRTDPPDHETLRRAVKTAFSPKTVQHLASKIQTTALTLVDELPSSGRVDLAESFTWALTLPIISDVLGIPERDRSLLFTWYQESEYSESIDVAESAAARFHDYVSDIAADRLSHPREDLMSELMTLCREGSLSKANAILLWRDLFEGGVDAPANLMGNALLGLAKHPDQHALIVAQRDDSAAMKLAVEEFVRYDAPIQSSSRSTTREVELHGERIPDGASILLLFGSANHDERRFPNPDTLDVTRSAGRNLGFGSGIHFCLGAPLTRLEAQIALPVLLSAIQEYEVVGPIERPRTDFVMRAILSLPSDIRKVAA